MSLDIASRLRRFLASAPQAVWPIQTLQISHPAMSRVFYLWREPYPGQVTTEDGSVVTMLPCNIETKLAGSLGHLDQKFDIRLGLIEADVQDQFQDEMDRVPLATREKVRVVYREYLSDDMHDPQAVAVLQAESFTYMLGAAGISAVSPRLNVTRTGELYAPKDIPMLRGFL
jgi:hypothetical protein